MKEHIDKMISVDVSEFINERVKNLERAVNTNNFNQFMDAICEYTELEKSMKKKGYSRQIHSARKRIYEIFGLSDLSKIEIK